MPLITFPSLSGTLTNAPQKNRRNDDSFRRGVVRLIFWRGDTLGNRLGGGQFPPAPRAHLVCTSFQVAMMLTGVLQMLAPVLPPKTRVWKV